MISRFAAQATENAIGATPFRARWATVRVDTDAGTFVGRLHVPEGKKRVSDVLVDGRLFLYLTEVTVGDNATVEPFLAINKNCVKTVRVLHEGQPEVVPRPTR